MDKLSKRQNQVLESTVALYKDEKITLAELYTMLIKYKVMSPGVLKVSSINTAMIKKLGPKTTIILK